MMDSQLKLQAFLDGELPEAEARAVAEELARDPQGAALLAELRQTGQALAQYEPSLRLPESREFYWSKIQREIERQSTAQSPRSVSVPWRVRWLRFLAPATTVAALAVVALLVLRFQSPSDTQFAQTNPDAMTYRDYDAKATLIWLSYPAEKEFAQSEPNDIIQ